MHHFVLYSLQCIHIYIHVYIYIYIYTVYIVCTYCIYIYRVFLQYLVCVWSQDPEHHSVWELGHHRPVPVLVALQLPAAGAAGAARGLVLPDRTHRPQGRAPRQGKPRLHPHHQEARRWAGVRFNRDKLWSESLKCHWFYTLYTPYTYIHPQVYPLLKSICHSINI